MRRAALLLLLLATTFAATAARAACTAKLQLQPNGKITVTLCSGTAVAVGQQFTINAGGVTIPVEAAVVNDSPLLGVIVTTNPLTTDTQEIAALSQGSTGTVTVKLGDATIPTDVIAAKPFFENYRRWNWAVGPATKEDQSGGTTTGSSSGMRHIAPNADPATGSGASSDGTGAFRLQFSGELAKGQPFGAAMKSGLQSMASISIDTTDRSDPGFVDNNRASFGFQATRISFANILKQGRVGAEGRVSKAFHHDTRDLDAVVTFAGWLPVIPTLNVLNTDGDFAAPPLSFALSYGYRNRKQEGDTFHGTVFEGTALYNVFAIDRINLEVQGTWTINQMSNRPAGTPKTQRMYKATIAYLQNPDKGFSVLTTIEDGSAGVMLTKVRQYFIGMALSKINFSGGSK